MSIENDFSVDSENEGGLCTSLFRELAHCLEHSIHHKALIKVGLKEINKADLINSGFGIATATLRNKMKAIQKE